MALKRAGEAGFDGRWLSHEKKETAQVISNAMTSVTVAATAVPVFADRLRPSFAETERRRITAPRRAFGRRT